MTEEQFDTWATILGFAYDNLSGPEFDHLLEASPFSSFKTALGAEDPDEWIEHKPFETHPLETTLFFQ